MTMLGYGLSSLPLTGCFRTAESVILRTLPAFWHARSDGLDQKLFFIALTRLFSLKKYLAILRCSRVSGIQLARADHVA